MAKKKRKLPPFIYVTKEMFRSDAFKQLNNSAKIAFLLLKDQVKQLDQTEIRLTYKQTSEYMTSRTYGRAIKQLIDAGFLKKIEQGGLYKGMNVYQFSDDWMLPNKRL